MADAAATFLLEQVKDIVKCHVELIANAKSEFEKLKEDLVKLKVYLKDADTMPEKDELFKNMERQIREAIYDVEDTIDKCLTDANTSKAKSSLKKLVRPGFNLAKEVKSLRAEKVNPILGDAQKHFDSIKANRLTKSTSTDQPWTKARKDQLIRQDKVVGFEDEEETLTNYLLDEKEELDVISIIGMPGLGKTTLAHKIFQKENICFEFPIRIWVSVSEKYNHREVFLKILEKFTSNDMSRSSDQELAQSVYACLEKERFLLVMDDVWSVEAWNAIKHVFPQTNKKGKVLVTSRDKNVGTHANVARDPHMLRFLREEESWKLLQLEVFGNLKDCPPELKDIGKRIADQCDGVPLTIVVIGGILVDQFTRTRVIANVKKEWIKVSENGLVLQTDKVKLISDVVELSYDRLPDDLRECFLYMGVFPEDHDIPPWTLTRLWIAEGFIHPDKGKTLEETADENMQHLISRNLLMVHKTNPIGEVKICRVHDMIRAFCITKAQEQNLFQEVKKTSGGVLEPPVSKVENFHRLCFHSDLSKFLLELQKPNGARVRSFLCFYKEPVDLKPEYTSAIPEAFKSLRVLESKSIKFQTFPKVTILIHLRYLTLCVEGLKLLPEPLSQLWNLQTLVVDTKLRMITMKANIWRMTRMRHIKTKAAIELDSKWKGEAGENLQTLTTLSPESFKEDVVKRAHNLKTMGFRGKIAILFNSSPSLLDKLPRLEKLKLMNDLSYESASEEVVFRLPHPNYFPPNLKRLTLSKTSLDWKQISILAAIPNLEVLKLKDNAFTGIEWNAVGVGFGSLQYLLITRSDLVIWKASPDQFPSLRCLVIKNCEELQEIPESLAEKLEKLELLRVRQSAVESARRIENIKKQRQEQERAKWGMVRFELCIDRGSEKQSN